MSNNINAYFELMYMFSNSVTHLTHCEFICFSQNYICILTIYTD